MWEGEGSGLRLKRDFLLVRGGLRLRERRGGGGCGGGVRLLDRLEEVGVVIGGWWWLWCEKWKVLKRSGNGCGCLKMG